MAKGCYEKILFSSVSSRLYEITKKELGIAYLDAAEYAHTVEEDKGRVEMFPWIKLLTLSQKKRLQETCSWFFTKATSLHKDALYALKHKSEFIRNEPLIGTHTDLVNVKNGVVNLLTKELLPHNPKYEFTYRNDGNYWGKDCEIEPSSIFEFFNSAFKRPDLHIDTIRSAVIVGLTGSGALTQCFVELSGTPGSGKGTTQKLVTFAIGSTNTYGTQIERLANRFETAAYIDKLHLRIGDASKFLNDRIFIMITGADELAVEIKNKSISDNQAFKGIVTLSSNSPIMISDSSLAIERRRILVAFNPRKDSHDRTLLELVNGKWIGEFADELDAFVTWCLNMSLEDAINHLRTVKKAIDSSRLEGFLETNVVARFLNDSVVKDYDGFIPTHVKDVSASSVDTESPKDLYGAFRNWHSQENPGHKIMTSREFTNNLKSFITQPTVKPLGLSYVRNNKRDAFHKLYGLRGVRFRSFKERDGYSSTSHKVDANFTIGLFEQLDEELA